MSRPGALQEAALAATGGVEYDITKNEHARLQNATPWRPDLLYKNPLAIDERWANACARIGRICEGIQAVPGTELGTVNFEASVRTCAMPRLAHEYAELVFYLRTKNKPHVSLKADHNPFRHMPDHEALWKFRALVEGICDRSTGKLGGWYTK